MALSGVTVSTVTSVPPESQRGGEKPPDASGEDETECNKAARRGGLRRDGIAEVSHPSHVP